GLKKIAVKLKPGRWKYLQNQSLYNFIIEKNYNKSLNVSVDMIEGQLHQIIDKTNFIIGGISTAVFEACYREIPFYIYEPLENGKPDELIKSSKIYNLKSISRKLSELEKKIINNKQSLISNRDYMINGVSFDKIPISSIL
ncbi:hypothetical protein OAK14_02155, partial [Candidatus Marinimicrobia bacterium]|nr:hypothetical protein [Candidatus Neomarinimicrobiota bacterium]